MFFETLKCCLPNRLIGFGRNVRKHWRDRQIQNGPQFSRDDLREIIVDRLGIQSGDVVCVHSSLDCLNLAFPFFQLLPMLQDIVGEQGTLLFPTFPRRSSYETLQSGELFDLRKSPSFMGALSELCRRMPQAVRSLHPTKSVCAIGPLAQSLCAGHENSPYPFDAESPFGKLLKHRGKVIGIGVSTVKMSPIHSVEDILKDDFPVKTYHAECFSARCLDGHGREVIVPTYAHNLDVMKETLHVSRFLRKHVAPSVCEDISIGGVPFFRADAKPLFDQMKSLAERGITVYTKRHLCSAA